MNCGFIAYVGNNLTEREIKKALVEVKLAREDDEYETYEPQVEKTGNVIFGQVEDTDYDKSLPSYFCHTSYVVHVDDDDIDCLAEELNLEDEVGDYDHSIIPCMVDEYDEKAVKILSQKEIECSYVGYNTKTNELMAFRVNGAPLYYGYTSANEIVFSDYEEGIKELCDEVHEFPDDSYYVDGNFYEMSQRRSKPSQGEQTVIQQALTAPKNPLMSGLGNAQDFLTNMNQLLSDITDSVLKENIEKIFDEYFKTTDPQQRVEDYLDKSLGEEVQAQVLERIRAEIENYNINSVIEAETDKAIQKEQARVHKKVNDVLNILTKEHAIPKVYILKSKEEIGRTKKELFHEKFEEILTFVQLDEPIMLIGPAGSGKNVAISQIAELLNQKMYYTNNASNEFKLTGFIDAGGHYQGTEFYKAFKNGGVFFLDEIDNSDPSALIVINSALANGYMAFPHETIDRHPDFRMIAAANTWGKGSDLQYVGRNTLDAATLDRFDNIFFDYDRKLEKSLYPHEQVLEFMWSFRDAVQKAKIPHVVSTRGIGKVYKKEIHEVPVEEILLSNVIKNLNQDDINTAIGNMNNIDRNNKYYVKMKELRIGK